MPAINQSLAGFCGGLLVALMLVGAELWRLRMDIQAWKANLLELLRQQREEAAAEHTQVMTAFDALNQRLTEALAGQVPQSVIDEVNASFAETSAAIQTIFETPTAPPDAGQTTITTDPPTTGEAA